MKPHGFLMRHIDSTLKHTMIETLQSVKDFSLIMNILMSIDSTHPLSMEEEEALMMEKESLYAD